MNDDDEPDARPEPTPDGSPDPADYCPECGRPLTRCFAWLYGDHREVDLL